MSDFSLIETMRFEPGQGLVRERLHRARLLRSARRLGFGGADIAWERLVAEVAALPAKPMRIRLELFRDGHSTLTSAPFVPIPQDTIWRVAVATIRLASSDRLLACKTSRRDAYDTARGEFERSDIDEVLLMNERGEICEGTITSVFIDDGSGTLKTPPLSCGLLAGVLRTELICTRRARVSRLSPADLVKGTLYVGNSLRGLIRARLVFLDSVARSIGCEAP